RDVAAARGHCAPTREPMAGRYPVTSGIALEITDLEVVRGTRRGLARVSCTGDAGEIVAIVGPSGAGKQAQLRCLGGSPSFSAGRVVIGGELVLSHGSHQDNESTIRQVHRKVGIVFQFHYLFEHLSAVHNVWLAPVHAYRVPHAEAERRARELLVSL